MSTLLHLIGTFFMFAGFLAILAGLLLLRTRQEDLGRMYLSTTMMSGGESSEGVLNRVLLACRANDRNRKRVSMLALAVGFLLALAGAALG